MATATEMLRNVVLLSHSHAGKTSLAEALLASGGAVSKLGKIADGTTLLDFDPEEIKRKISINTSTASYIYKEHKINLSTRPDILTLPASPMRGSAPLTVH